MNKKIPMILGLVMASSFAFASCDSLPFGKKDCEHTFSESWSTDKTHHWHAATCEHGEEKDAYAEHADANEDGVCDVCEYEIGHTHGYSADWSTNDTHHWHAATCTHTDEKSEYALHTDADTNGECDVCKGHVHVVSDAGYCDGCGTQVEPLKEDLAKIVNATVSQGKNVVSGQVNYKYRGVTLTYKDDNGQNAYANLDSKIQYTLGAQDTYVERSNNSEVYNISDATGEWTLGRVNDSTKLWFYTEDGEVKGLQEYTIDGEMTPSIVSADEDSLAGYYFAVSTLADGYGAEEILFNLYTLSQEDSASDFTEYHNPEKNTFSFSFNSLIINTDTAEGEDDSVRYYETSVKFTYSDRYELTNLEIKCDAYTNDAGTIGNNTYEADKDYDYDQDSKTITMREGAEPDTYTFVVSQEFGKRSYVHDKDMSAYLPSGFNFTMNGETVEDGQSLELTTTDSLKIDFDCEPATTSFDLIRNMVDAKLICTSGNSDSYAYIDFDSEGNKSIAVSQFAPGTYTLSFTYDGDTVFSMDITVTAPIVTGTYIPVVITENNAFYDLASFEAPASGAYTFKIPAGYGACDKEAFENNERPYIDPMDPFANQQDGGEFTVDIAQGDTYEFYLMAPYKGTHNIVYTFEAKEVVSGGDQDGGNTDPEKYNTVVVEGMNTLYFSQAEIAAATATRSFTVETEAAYKLTSGNLFVSAITASDGTVMTKDNSYYYTLTAGTYTITFSNLAMFGVKADTACILNVESKTPSTEQEPVGSLSEDEKNTVTVTNEDINIMGSILYTFMPWNDGDYVFEAEFDCIIMDANKNELGTNTATLVSYTQYIIKFDVSDLYLGGDYTVTVTWLPPLGSQDNPNVLTETGNYTATYAGNYASPVWYVYTPAVDGTLTIANGSDTASLVCGAAFGYEKQTENDGDDLTISVVGGISYYIGVADWNATSSVDIAFTVSFTAGNIERDGTRNAPYSLTAGDMTCSVPEYEIVVYAYLPTTNGTLTATTTSTGFDWNFSDSLNSWDSNTENASISIEVVAGKLVYLFVSTASFSAAEIAINVSFEESLEIDVTTMEGDGSSATPFVLTGAGVYDMGTVNAYPGYYVSITADETMTVTLTSDYSSLYTTGWSNLAYAGSAYSKTIEAGETFTFIVVMETGTADVLLTVEIA